MFHFKGERKRKDCTNYLEEMLLSENKLEKNGHPGVCNCISNMICLLVKISHLPQKI